MWISVFLFALAAAAGLSAAAVVMQPQERVRL